MIGIVACGSRLGSSANGPSCSVPFSGPLPSPTWSSHPNTDECLKPCDVYRQSMSTISRIGSRFRTELLAQIISAGSGALVVIVLARLLEPDGYGLLYLALAFFGTAKLFTKLGVGRSASRYVAEYKEKDPSQVPHILRISFTVILFLVAVVSVTVLAGHRQIATVLGEPELAPLLVVGSLYLIFGTVINYVRKILQGFESIQIAAYVDIIKSTSNVVFAIGLVLIGFGAVGALVGYVISMFLGSVIGLAVIYTRFYQGIDEAVTREEDLFRRIVEYAVPLTATQTADTLDKDIDTVLVGFFLNPLAVSYYVISKQTVNFIKAPVRALGFTITPSLGSEKSKGNVERAARLYETSLVYTLLLYIPAGVGIILIATPLIEIVFGAQYTDAGPVLQVLGIFAILLSITKITSHGLDYLGRARARAIVKGITAVMNVGLNILLIPTIGVIGAAIATVITYSLYTMASLYIMHHELSLRVGYVLRYIALIVAISAVMGAVVFQLVGHIEGWISLFSVVGLGVVIWGLLSILSGLVDYRKVIAAMT